MTKKLLRCGNHGKSERRPAMGKASRDKGKRGERRAVKLLQPVYPDAYRSANQAGSDACCDVEGTPWWCEAKEGKTHQIWAAVRQAVEAREAAKDTRPIVVISHRSNGMTLAVVPWESWRSEMDWVAPLSDLVGSAIRWETIACRYPVRVTRRPGRDDVVVMTAADFVELLKR
jgi:hypothetical protein